MTQNRFEELLGLMLDDDISPNQLDELVETITIDPSKLKQLRDHMMLSDHLSQYEDELRDEARFLAALEAREQASDDAEAFVRRVAASVIDESENSRQTNVSQTPVGIRGFRKILVAAGWLVASVALLLIAGLIAYLANNRGRITETAPQLADDDPAERAEVDDDGVAVLSQVVKLTGAPRVLRVGDSISPGSLAWDEGLLQLEFYCGATVVVEGPAEIEVLDESRVVCRLGRLRAHVPEPARGFVVLAPSIELVDLGTEFGLNVANDGAAEVHVFNGKVELYDPKSNRNLATRRELNAGDAMTVDRDGMSIPIALRDADFVTPAQLNQMTEAQRHERLREWRTFRDSMRSDPRVAAYFSFDRENADGRKLIGVGDDETTLEGAVVGCEWTEGRWPTKSSLQFKRPSDRVRINVPGEFESLTYTAWVRVDGLDRSQHSLLLTDGYGRNSLHWQIRQDGNLVFGMRYSRNEWHNYASDSIFDLFRLGQWVHLATVYDAHQKRVTHYVNGERAKREALKQPPSGPLKIGKATIGNWSVETRRHRKLVRNFNGCMDELIVYRDALDDQEVRRIYEVGAP